MTEHEPIVQPCDEPEKPSRRWFLKTVGIVGGGLVIGIPLLRDGPGPWPHVNAKAFTPSAFLQITAENSVHFYVPATEMGQGVNHGLVTLVAEELDIEPSLVQTHHAGVHEDFNNPLFGMQGTGGSTSMAAWFLPLRQAGAQAREALRQAAAESLGVPADTLTLADGWVHGAGETYPWGDFVDLAAVRPVPEEVTLKSTSQFRFIGQAAPRVDAVAKSTGTAQFGMDVDFPGLKRAAVKHPPVIGATVKTFDPSVALEMPGVIGVWPINQGIAVVAETWWQASKAADAVTAEWDFPELSQHSSETLDQDLRSALDSGESEEFETHGQPAEALDTSAQRVTAEYFAPYLAHATMEPQNCTVRIENGRCEIWAPNQGPQIVQAIAAFETGMDRADIGVHTTFLGGGFGRRSYLDFVREALQIAVLSGHPVQLAWSREDDMRNDYYRPASRARFEAGLDDQGQIQAWRVKRAGPNLFGYMFEEMAGLAPEILPDGLVRWAGGLGHGLFESWVVDKLSVEGMFADYEVANVDIHHVTVDPGLRTGFWRSVGHSISGFFKETFMDELALAAGRDPLQFRLDHLASDSRLRPLLEQVASDANWGNPPVGQHQGIAVHSSFGSAVAQVAEVSVQGGQIRVHKVYCAVDCGLAVNPDMVRSQMESGINYGLTAALYGRIDLDGGAVRQGNFHDYPVLRMPDAPRVVVSIMPSEAHPTGVGEPGLPPLAAAVGNAVFAATGQRLRSLPFELS